MKEKIVIISGPNLNLLGERSENHYGNLTYKKLNRKIELKYPEFRFIFFQSNSEGKIIDYLQKIRNKNILGIVINLAAYTHTSVAIRDTLELIRLPKVEVHLSNIKERESFRQLSLISDVCDQTFMGLKEVSYYNAIDWIANLKK